jgi:predicted PhzF superfamily epimerase YddE/YHI9
MKFHVVDAFTDIAFAGNPAAVVLLDSPADAGWMQSVAAEFKHSETAFVEVAVEGPQPLRWFTPVVEVDLCGHATLATAHALGGDQVFTTRSGELRCRAENGWVSMDFPADPPAPTTAELDDLLPGLTVEHIARGVSDVMVVVTDEDQVRTLKPDLDRVRLPGTRCVIVTARSHGGEFDFVSRVFGAGAGVGEDPVTGSAHCTLASYWGERLGRTELIGRQVSSRGGTVRMTLAGDRVRLSGQAVTVASGELYV